MTIRKSASNVTLVLGLVLGSFAQAKVSPEEARQ